MLAGGNRGTLGSLGTVVSAMMDINIIFALIWAGVVLICAIICERRQGNLWLWVPGAVLIGCYVALAVCRWIE